MFAVRVALVSCIVAVSGLVVTTGPSEAAVSRDTSSAADSSFVYLAGYSRRHGLIINDFDNSRILAVRADGSHLRVLHTDAQAIEVVGGLIEYFRPSDEGSSDRDYFFDLDNDHHGVVPKTWTSLTIGGGVHVARQHDGWHLYYEPDTGAPERDFGVMTDVPNVHPMYFNFGASERGLLVVGSFKSNRPAVTEFYPTPNARPHHRLNTQGISRGTFLLCPHIATAIGCTDDDVGQQVIGLSQGRANRPSVRHTKAAIGDVVFAQLASGRRYAYSTLNDTSDSDNGPQCTCAVHFGNGTIVKGIVDATLMTDDTRVNPSVFYVKYTARGSAVYRSHFGRGRPTLVVRAPRIESR
jgi:hypothetical protein